MQVILTSRPLSLNPISWVNSITRIKTRSPFDHVAIDYSSVIYESAAGTGVHMQEFNDWTDKRKGSYLFCYEIPDIKYIDFAAFWQVKGSGYDYKANLLFLFGAKKGLKRNHTKRWFCSELVATMLRLKNPFEFTPDDIEEYCRKAGWKLTIVKL